MVIELKAGIKNSKNLEFTLFFCNIGITLFFNFFQPKTRAMSF